MDIFTSVSNWFCGYGAGFANWAGHGHGGWMPFHFGGLLPLLIVGTLAFMAYKLIRKENPAHQNIALDIIKRRYAEGEIDHQTYQRLKEELKK